MYNKFIIKELGRNSFTVLNQKTNETQGYYTSSYTDDILDLLVILNRTDYTLTLIMKYLDNKIAAIENSNYDGDEETMELVKLLDDARLDELKLLKNRIKNEVLEITVFSQENLENMGG